MVVSLSLGENKSKKIINTLKKGGADNVDFYHYETVQAMVKEAKLRHIDFKRIILSTSILKDVEKDLNDLNDFVKNYSSATEVVLVVMSADAGADKIFNSIFNAPMYTPVILTKATSKNLLELVLSNILELKSKYYILDAKPDEDNPVLSEKSSEKVEEVNSQVNSDNDVVNPSETTSENKSEFFGGPKSIFTGFGGVNTLNTEHTEDNNSEKSEFNSDGSSLGGDSLTEVGNFESEEFDEDLSIGDFGSQHSDTGFLDEDEEDVELQEYLKKKQEKITTPEKNVIEIKKPIVETRKENLEERIVSSTKQSVDLHESSTVVEEEYTKIEVQEGSSLPNIDLVVANRGSGSTQAIIDEAVKIVKADNVEVLIIDLDSKENGILSFIDVDRFYRENAQEGIIKQRIYKEDGVSIISNGYGMGISNSSLKSLFSSKVLSKFDMIFIDCPIDCLSVLDKGLIDMFNVLVISGGDKSRLVSTSIALTNRKYVSLYVEKCIMGKCMVEILGKYSKDDVDSIKNTCLFANGNWLDHIGL